MTNEECVRQKMRRVYSLLLSLNGKGKEQNAGGERLDNDTQAATEAPLAEKLRTIIHSLEGGCDDISSDWTTN